MHPLHCRWHRDHPFFYNKCIVAKLVSVIIPNRNGSSTIGRCLEAAFSSRYDPFEVIVVDDCSWDDSLEIIKRFPCRLIRLQRHSGASKARNTGASNSNGEILFFTDADCLLEEDALSRACETLEREGPGVIVGGTYTPLPYDRRFFSIFQSVFINYSETKRVEAPDYIATHAMAIDARVFRDSGGFPEEFLPILEDVEFSHRLRRGGYRLLMDPAVQVRHIFDYSMARSLGNAVRKSRYWTQYSLMNRDLLADSGTASVELKVNVLTQFVNLSLLVLWMLLQKTVFLLPLLPLLLVNLFTSRGLLRAFRRTGGSVFALLAGLYYTMPYSLAVGTGAFMGTVRYLLEKMGPSHGCMEKKAKRTLGDDLQP